MIFICRYLARCSCCCCCCCFQCILKASYLHSKTSFVSMVYGVFLEHEVFYFLTLGLLLLALGWLRSLTRPRPALHQFIMTSLSVVTLMELVKPYTDMPAESVLPHYTVSLCSFGLSGVLMHSEGPASGVECHANWSLGRYKGLMRSAQD